LREGVDRVDALFVRRNIAFGGCNVAVGDGRRLTAGWQLAAVRPARGFFAFGDG
jgi:hypothetical protein